ncbi:MAG: extracellular solute-binding protein [Rhodobacteraceae bacterium]|nr:extracellular solute-binding protein [Paracoccaceae bacterium]
MTDPSQNPEPSDQDAAGSTPAPQSAHGSHARAWRMAGVLSALLIFSWAAYVGLTPNPKGAGNPGTSITADHDPPLPAIADEQSLTLVAPGRLIDASIMADFEQSSGLKVRLVTYPDEDSFRGDAIAQTRTADVVLTSGPNIRLLADAGRLQIMPLHRIDAAASLDPAMVTRVSAYDPDRFHALPYAWLTIGIGYDRSALTERLGANADLSTWGLIFDPTSAARLASCGLQSIDAPTAAFPAALAYLSRSPAASGVADIEAAASLWDGVKGFFNKFDSRDIARNLANGEVCAAIAPSADIYQARGDARSRGVGSDIEFVIPREGAMLRVYFLAIAAQRERVDAAAQLVSYLLKPDVAAAMTNRKWIANAVTRSRNFLRPEVQDDVFIYPDAAVMARLTLEPAAPGNDSGLRSRLWRMINAPPPKR